MGTKLYVFCRYTDGLKLSKFTQVLLKNINQFLTASQRNSFNSICWIKPQNVMNYFGIDETLDEDIVLFHRPFLNIVKFVF